MDIATWLRELGLERYGQAFRDHDIAPAVLPELTDQDLRELGVTARPKVLPTGRLSPQLTVKPSVGSSR